MVEASPLSQNGFTLNKFGLKLGIFSENPKPRVRLSNFKTNNSLHYVLASLYSKENSFDDCLLVNDQGNVVESTNSNVFVVFDNEVCTPPLSEGCVDGVARSVILSILRKKNILYLVRPIALTELPQATEILVSNAVRGPRWASGIGAGKSEITLSLVNWLNEMVDR
jgi:branched-chain amino acid aminotransferase